MAVVGCSVGTGVAVAMGAALGILVSLAAAGSVGAVLTTVGGRASS